MPGPPGAAAAALSTRASCAAANAPNGGGGGGGGVSHGLALALLHAPGEPDDRRWERCVAAWAAVLHDAGFWARLRATAGRRYGVPVEESLVPVVRAGLRELIERRMPEDGAGSRIAPGPLLQREADAAQLLAAVGGFPSAGGGGVPLFCGPLRVAELGRTAEFGAFAAAHEARVLKAAAAAPGGPGMGHPGPAMSPAGAATGPAPSAAYASLTYAFSELGFAQLLLG
ncbi:hypothetical protein, partial [Streptomyces flavofungini]|uniref:hypothetical protein n=1 Tax=Streptomyces flavofungini TaxID=68200 RepID=UPI003F7DB91D